MVVVVAVIIIVVAVVVLRQQIISCLLTSSNTLLTSSVPLFSNLIPPLSLSSVTTSGTQHWFTVGMYLVLFDLTNAYGHTNYKCRHWIWESVWSPLRYAFYTPGRSCGVELSM